MSAKKSWDIRPSPRRAVQVTRDSTLTRRGSAPRAAVAKAPPLRARRRAARKRLFIALAVIVLILIGIGFYLLSRPAFRVTHIDAAGEHADALPALATLAMQGSYFYIIPRDSIFFVPEEEVRQAILAAYPDISAVSISRSGFDTLKVNALPRVASFAWCGGAVASSTEGVPCYEADAEGYVFAPIAPILATDASSTSSLVPEGTLKIYAPLMAEGTTSPLRDVVGEAQTIPDALRFTHAMQSLGAHVDSLQLRGDEADLYLMGGTRITYLVGHEQAAADLAATAFPSLSLNDGSLQYIDLRFDGKVYYKKEGE